MSDPSRAGLAISTNNPADEDLAMVVVHYRDPEAIGALLSSVDRWTLRPASITIVDNSGDLAEPRYKSTFLVAAGDNLGYAGAVNLGWRHILKTATPTWILVCTQDARLDPSALETMMRSARSDASISVCAPVLYFRSDPAVVFSRGGRLFADGTTSHLGRGDRGNATSAAGPGSVDVDWADGAILLIRLTALVELGGLPEEYFLYVEEVDFQHQVRNRGWRVVVERGARGFQSPGNYRAFLEFRNNIYFTRKYKRDFHPWPWRRLLVQRIKRGIRHPHSADVVGAICGVVHANLGKMGKPKFLR